MTFEEAEAELAARDFMICRNETVTRYLASVGVEVIGLDMSGRWEVGQDDHYQHAFEVRPAEGMKDGHGARYIPRWAWLIYTTLSPREKCEAAIRAALVEPALQFAVVTCFLLVGEHAVPDLFKRRIDVASATV